MSILEQVKEAIGSTKTEETGALQAALNDAARMSDQFSDVKPVPYIVPIERFAGLAVSKGTTNLG